MISGTVLYVGENPEKLINNETHLIMSLFQDIDNFNKENSFDFIYLEDELQKIEDLKNFLIKIKNMLKPNGILITKVPDFALYEKYLWPSIFMLDHKHTFSQDVERDDQNRENHWHYNDLEKLAIESGFTAFEMNLDDTNYDYEARLLENQTKKGASCHLILKFFK